nr:MAG TPA: hypothetical protein [Caudoviricetes sp.]
MTRKDSRERSRKASVRNINERELRVRDEYPGIIADLKRIASRLRALRAMTDVDDIDAAIENLKWELGVINAL